CIRLLKRQIKDLYTSNNADYHKNTNAVWIPYQEILGGSLSSNRGIDNRVTARIFSLLNIISLAKQNLRSKMVYGTEKLVVASLEDLGEVLRITQNISGMPTHKIQFYADIFMPLYNSEDGPKVKDDKAEMRTGVTTTQLREYYKSQTGKTLSSNNIKQTYLNELLNNGYIDEEDSLIDKRGKIYFPLIELPQDKITNYNKLEQVDDFLQCSRIILPKYYSKVPDNWLKLEILSLLKYPIRLDKFQLIDQDNKETCICQFVESYEKKLKLSGFFTNSESTKLRTEIFGNVKFIGKNYGENYNNLSIQDKVLQFDNSSSQVSTCEATI
ncbi:MAG: hypothetical protein WB474_03970, partial [Nitrososphaeraceae archaeon]